LQRCVHRQLSADLPWAFSRNATAESSRTLAPQSKEKPTTFRLQRRRGSAVRCNRLLGVIVPLAPEYNMGGFLRRNELKRIRIQERARQSLEQSLSPAQQDRRDSDVQLINEAARKILLDSVRSAANAHIHSVGCVARPVKRLVNNRP